MKRLKDIITNPLSGPFSDIYNRHSSLEFLETIASTLDMTYILNHSGDKPLSPVAYRLIYGEYAETLGNQARGLLADSAYTQFADKWTRLFDALNLEYNPIQNYDMTEKTIKDETTTTFGKKIDDDLSITFGKKVDDDDTITFGKKIDDDNTNTYGKTVDDDDTITFGKRIDDDDSLIHGKAVTKTGSQNENEVDTPRVETTTAESVNAYNNAGTATPKSKTVVSHTGTDEKDITTTYTNVKDQESGTDTDNRDIVESGTEKHEKDYQEGGTDSQARDISESGTEKHEKDYEESGTEGQDRDIQESGTEKNERDYEFTRSGNIGVTTSQQMLESEWELRKHNLYKMMMEDLDTIYCIPCY